MLTRKALIQIAPFYEKIFTVTAFRTFKSFGPSEPEEMFPAIIFRLKAVHKLSQIHCVLLHAFTSLAAICSYYPSFHYLRQLCSHVLKYQ